MDLVLQRPKALTRLGRKGKPALVLASGVGLKILFSLMSKIFYINNKALQCMSSILVLFQNA